MKLILIILLLSSAAFGQIISPSNIRTIKQFKNYIQNPDLEYNNEAGITDSSSIAVPVSGATTALNGTYSLSIDGTASGQKVKFKLNTLPNKFEPGDGEFSFIYKGTMGSSSGDYKAYIENNTGTKKSPEFTLYSTGSARQQITGWFNGDDPIDNPYFLVIESTQSAPESFVIDDVYAGDITSIGQFSAIGDWQSFTPIFTGFGTVTSIEFQWRINGDSIEITGQAVAGTPTAVEARISLPNNLMSANTTKIPTRRNLNLFGRGTTTNNVLSSMIEPNVTYMTFGTTASANPLSKANGTDIVAAGNSFSLGVVTIPIAGLSASTSAAAANQTDYGRTSYTPVFVGLGAVTSPECFHWRVSENLFIECKAITGTPTAVTVTVSLPNSLVIASSAKTPSIHPVGFGSRSGATGAPIPLATPGASVLNFANAGGTNNIAATLGTNLLGNSETFGFFASVPIEGWAPNQRAATLSGSVTSNSTGADVLERVIFAGASETSTCTASPCTTYRPSGGIASVTRTGTGLYSINFNSNVFSSTPTCVCNTGGAGSAVVFCSKNPSGTFSSTRFDVQTLNNVTTVTDSNGYVICTGPR